MEKKNTGLIVLIIILSSLVVGLGGFIIYDRVLSKNEIKNNDNNNNNVNSNNNNADLLTNDEAIAEGKRLYDKATEIYETWVVRPYCGVVYNDINEQNVETLGDSGYGNGRYYKSSFKSFDELKEFLEQWLSEDIINEKVVKQTEWNGEINYNYVEDLSLLSKKDSHYTYIDYVLKDNTLYCRLDTGKGWLSLYQDRYDIKVSSIVGNKIIYTITSAYVKQGSDCHLNNFKDEFCSENDLEYRDTTFVIRKNSTGNFVVSEYTLHN